MKHEVEIRLLVNDEHIQLRKEFNTKAKNHLPYWIDKWINDIRAGSLYEIEIISVIIDNNVDITKRILSLKK